MKTKYVSPNAELVSICSEDIMNGSAEKVLKHSASGIGDAYTYGDYFED